MRADGSPLVIESSHTHKGSRLLVKFEGIDTRSAAEELRGPVYITEEQQRRLTGDQYWQHELVGCAVVTGSGDEVGEVSSVVGGPVQDLLSVEHDGRTYLVPLVKEIVVQVDLEARRVTIDPPDGLVS